jgi:hypothetical protein
MHITDLTYPALVLEAEVFNFMTAKASEPFPEDTPEGRRALRLLMDLSCRSGRDAYLIETHGLSAIDARSVSNAGDSLPKLFSVGRDCVDWNAWQGQQVGLKGEPTAETHPGIAAYIAQKLEGINA